jgi:lipopolysaccharide/colanic/teichoic acid biosynthesis glycosyltransferase
MDTLTNTISVKERIDQEVSVELSDNGSADIYLPSQFEEMAHGQYTAKRLVDVVLASAAFLFLALLFPFISLGIKLSSK